MRKHKTLLWAVIAFFLSLSLCSVLVVSSVRNRTGIEQATMEQVIMEKSLKVNEVVSRLVYKTQALAAIVVQNDGDITDFDRVAATLVDDPSILNVLIAPNGIVEDIYSPEEDGEIMYGFDFFDEMAGNIEAQQAIEEGHLVFSGPFMGVQGREILSGRLPVYLPGENGENEFWGLVAVTLKYPEVLDSAGLGALEMQGFAYEIWRFNPDDGQKQVIAHSPYDYNPGALYVEKEMNILGSTWYFRILPVRAWYQYLDTWLLILASVCISVLIAFITANNIVLNRVKKSLQKQENHARQAARNAEAASLMKTSFLATMSHEIRTPMNGIIGFSELAAEEVDKPEKVRGYIDKIREITGSLLHIIDDILDISKIEAGKIELEHLPFSVGEVTDACAAIVGPRADQKGIDLRFNIDPNLREKVMGDPTRLRQVLLNLLSNAIKFTELGSVTLWCRVLEQDDSTGCLTLQFEIKDTGIGMTTRQVDRIMEPFAQADSSTTRRYGGTGLGLPISNNLIDLMGGKLQVKSSPGVGSQFVFDLPFEIASNEARPVVAQTSFTHSRPIFQGDVLVCEDTSFNREVITEQLKRAGLQVSCVQDGREAVELMRLRLEKNRPFALVFMDIYMPVMDGPEASAQLRELGCTCPIIAMTANVLSSERAAYRKAGMPDCLAKPFTSQELWTCLSRHLTPGSFAPLASPTSRNEVESTDSSVLRREVGLQLTEGDEERYRKLLDRFVTDNKTMYDSIDKAVNAGDWKQAHRLTHSLKGMAVMIGATRLSTSARRAEAGLRGGRADPRAMEEMYAELAAVLDELGAGTPN